jgi:predicted SnoaL-like aldol condensation-catalyzing enzyme
MKQLILFTSAISLCLLMSCNSKESASTTTSDKAQKNLDASRVVSKAFETGDPSGVDSVVSSNFINHTETGEVKGRDSLKAMITMMHGTMKDMKMQLVNEAANDDYVYSWMRFTGTNDVATPYMPKGPYDMEAIEVAKCSDGKIVEHWEFVPMPDMMKNMNNMGGNKMMDNKMDNKMMNKTDTTKTK